MSADSTKRTFDVGAIPGSIPILKDPKERQQEAWEIACNIRNAEQTVDDELKYYTTTDFETLFNISSAGRTDLRSVGRLLEALHEHDIASFIDENKLYAIGKNTDRVMHFAPIIGGANTFIQASVDFADAPEDDRRAEYHDFLFSLACFLVECGLFYVSAPYKLAWRGTRIIFFSHHATLFRLGRYGGNRFVAFIMSEVHYEIREALYEDVVTADKAEQVVAKVNEYREPPEFANLRKDASEELQKLEEFTRSELEKEGFARDIVDKSQETGSGLFNEVVELSPMISLGEDTSLKGAEDLVLSSDTDWSSKVDDNESGISDSVLNRLFGS